MTCQELPGLITEAKNGKDLLEKFNDAVLTYYDVPKKEGDLGHNQLNIDGYGTFTLNTVENAIQTVWCNMGQKDFNRKQCIKSLIKLGFIKKDMRRGSHDKYTPPKEILEKRQPD